MRRRFNYVQIVKDADGERFQNVRRRTRAQAEATHVYLLRRKDGLIKVGISKNVHLRLSAVRNASPDRIEIARIVPAGKGMALAIESGFKALMQTCRQSGEWFTCDERLAIVALHVVEHGDLLGCTLVRAEIGWQQTGRNERDREARRVHSRAFEDYLQALLQEFPAIRDHANPWSLQPAFILEPARRRKAG